MGKLYVPSEKVIIGPWLLGLTELEDLDTLVEFIDNKLNQSRDIEFQTEAKKKVEDGKFNTIEEALEFNSKYSFDKDKKKSIVLISDDETRLKDESLKNILIDTRIKSFKPKELDISIEYGYSNIFNLTVRKRFDGELAYKIKCFDHDIESEINYKVENWVEKNQPNKAKKIWNKYSPLFIWFFAMVFLITSIKIYTVETPSTYSIYQLEIEQLLSEGINSNNQSKATEILLKLNTNYLPEHTKSIEKVNYSMLRISVIALILILISWIKPRTTIGVGKHKSRIKIYNYYTKFILISIPAIFILPPIIEFIKSL